MMQSIPTVLTTLTKIQWNERNVCIANSYITYFMVSYSATNGLCIAIVRLLYIKKGSWLRYDFGEMRMIRITVVSSMAASALLTIMYGHEISSNRSAYNLCMGHSHEFQVKLAVP